MAARSHTGYAVTAVDAGATYWYNATLSGWNVTYPGDAMDLATAERAFAEAVEDGASNVRLIEQGWDQDEQGRRTFRADMIIKQS